MRLGHPRDHRDGCDSPDHRVLSRADASGRTECERRRGANSCHLERAHKSHDTASVEQRYRPSEQDFHASATKVVIQLWDVVAPPSHLQDHSDPWDVGA